MGCLFGANIEGYRIQLVLYNHTWLLHDLCNQLGRRPHSEQNNTQSVSKIRLIIGKT